MHLGQSQLLGLTIGGGESLAYRRLAAWLDLGHVKGVEAELFGVGVVGLHDLDFGHPFDLFAGFDCFPEVALRVVWVFAGDADGLGLGELLLAVFGDEVVFDVDEFAGSIDPEGMLNLGVRSNEWIWRVPFERVASVAVLISPALWGAMVAEKN